MAMATESLGVIRFSARKPAPISKVEKTDGMVIEEIDWKWDDSIKELVPYVKGKIDLQEVTDSYKDQAGVKNILAMVAQGDFSMVRQPTNLGDITDAPNSIHEATHISEAAKTAAAALDSLGLKDADGKPITAEKLSKKEAAEITNIVQSYLDGLTEGAKQDGKHE